MDDDIIDYMSEYRTEAEAVFHNMEFRVEVAKVGGGTPGRRYEGHWILNLYQHDVLEESHYVRNGAPLNHLEVAVAFAGHYLAMD